MSKISACPKDAAATGSGGRPSNFQKIFFQDRESKLLLKTQKKLRKRTVWYGFVIFSLQTEKNQMFFPRNAPKKLWVQPREVKWERHNAGQQNSADIASNVDTGASFQASIGRGGLRAQDVLLSFLLIFAAYKTNNWLFLVHQKILKAFEQMLNIMCSRTPRRSVCWHIDCDFS